MVKTKKRNKHIGVNIVQARGQKGMTQLALAHALGWKGADAGAQISRIESGVNEPRLSTIQAIARVLCVTVDSLISTPSR
jgi:transcriptional regulator with XRE-family HTH domain